MAPIQGNKGINMTATVEKVSPKFAGQFAKFDSKASRNVDGWLKVEVGAEFAGRLVGWLNRDGMNEGEYVKNVLVELTVPCKAFKKGKEEVELAPGQVLGVPVNPSLKPILGYVAGSYKVYAFCSEQKTLPPAPGRNAPRKMYVWDLKVEPGAVARKLPPSIAAERDRSYEDEGEGADTGDKIPF